MMLPAAKALMVRGLRLLLRRRGDALQPELFAVRVVVVFRRPRQGWHGPFPTYPPRKRQPGTACPAQSISAPLIDQGQARIVRIR